MKLVLHVGLGKTGTSALQTFLARESADADAAGVFFANPVMSNADTGYVFSDQGEVSDAQALTKGLEAFARKASEKKGVTQAIWSNEALSMSGKTAEVVETIKAFVARDTVFDEVRVLLVLRRQDEWVESAYRQWALKHKTYTGFRIMPVDAYIETTRRMLDYEAIYDLWSQIGPVDFADYGEVIESGGIARFICDYLGMPWHPRYESYSQVHPSLGPAQSYLNATFNSGHYGTVLPKEFSHVIKRLNLPEISPKGAAFLSTERRAELVETYAESNARLAEKLGRARLFAASDVREVKEYKRGPTDVVRYLTMIVERQQDMINTMSRRLKEAEDKIDALSKR